MDIGRFYTVKEASKLLGDCQNNTKVDKGRKIKCVITVGSKRRVPESEIIGVHEDMKVKVVGYVRLSPYTQHHPSQRHHQSTPSSKTT